MPKHRDRKNRDLIGTNIKANTKGGSTYYYYVQPDGTQIPLAHNDRATSIEAAIALNQHFRRSGDIIEKIINTAKRSQTLDSNPLWPGVVDLYREHPKGFATRTYKSADSRATAVRILDALRDAWPHSRIAEIKTMHIADYLDALGSPHTHAKYRTQLNFLFSFASKRGFDHCRPMDYISYEKPGATQRKKHNWDGYKAVYDACEPWLQDICDLALYTLQRRSDLAAIKVEEQVNLKKGSITLRQQKVDSNFLEIRMGGELEEVVNRVIYKTGIICPYLVRRRHKRIKKAEGRTHPFQVLPDMITKEYTKARDKSGAYNHLPPKERPTFHCIRGLGIWLYHKAGYPIDYICSLSGHASKEMFDLYFDGHEQKQPVAVNAGLSLSGVALTDINWETDLPEVLKKIADESDDD